MVDKKISMDLVVHISFSHTLAHATPRRPKYQPSAVSYFLLIRYLHIHFLLFIGELFTPDKWISRTINCGYTRSKSCIGGHHPHKRTESQDVYDHKFITLHFNTSLSLHINKSQYIHTKTVLKKKN